MKKKLMWIPGLVLIAIIVTGFYPGRGDIYFEIARQEERFKVIDGTQNIETIQNQIISELELIDRR